MGRVAELGSLGEASSCVNGNRQKFVAVSNSRPLVRLFGRNRAHNRFEALGAPYTRSQDR